MIVQLKELKKVNFPQLKKIELLENKIVTLEEISLMNLPSESLEIKNNSFFGRKKKESNEFYDEERLIKFGVEINKIKCTFTLKQIWSKARKCGSRSAETDCIFLDYCAFLDYYAFFDYRLLIVIYYDKFDNIFLVTDHDFIFCGENHGFRRGVYRFRQY